MDLESRKIEFVQEFLKIQSEEVISRLENVLRKENKKSDNDEFQPMTIEEFKSRIDKSMDDSKNDRIIKASELKARMKKWS